MVRNIQIINNEKQTNKNPNRKLTALYVICLGSEENRKVLVTRKRKKKKKATLRITNTNPHLWRFMSSIHIPNLKWFQIGTIPMFMGKSIFLIKEWTPHIPNSTNESKTNKKLPQVYIETKTKKESDLTIL